MGENAEGTAKSKEAGRLLGGRYRLGDVLGRGGMGTVWRAEDEILGRTVAVKELRFPSDIDEDEKRRLITRTLREAKAIARIRNGSAITVFDVVDEDSRPWIVMELIEGRSLADAIKEDGPLTPRRAAQVGLSVLGVLRAAHREGIVHRDVKPSNVLVEEETGRIILTDFGIAKVEGDPSVTSTGMLVGAPSYISPERARGQRPGPPADMWSLGGLLYAAVEGQPPYDKGSAIATLTAVMTDPLDPPEHAGELEEVIYGLLVKDPEKRLDEAGARVLLQAVLDAPEDHERAANPERTSSSTMALPLKSGSKSGAAASAMSGDGGAAAKDAGKAGVGAAGVGTASAASSAQRETPPDDPRVSSTASASATGAGGGGPRRWSPAVMIAVVAVVLLGLLGVVVAFAMNRDGDGGSDNGKGDSAATAGGGNGKDEQGSGQDRGEGGEADGGSDSGKGDDGKGDTAGTGGGEDGDKEGAEEEDGMPEGYDTLKDDRFRFTMAMPEDFSRVGVAGRNSGGIYAAKKNATTKLQVDFTDSPSQSALNAWQLLESAVDGFSTDYKKLGMKSVEWREYPTVSDWNFERTEHGERVRVLNRGFKVDDDRGYAIVVTCKASEWDDAECKTMRETAFDTFDPAGS